MKCVVFATLLALAAARHNSPYGSGQSRSSDEVPIIRDDRVHPSASGEYSFNTETGDGITRSESGQGSGPDGAVETKGFVSFTFPDGKDFELSFVADAEGGYQAQSDWIPVAPAFPHPIPQFVLDQIAKAAEEDAAAARSGGKTNTNRYN